MGNSLPNINSAMAEDIKSIGGISDQVANAIVDYIADNSPLDSLATLEDVQGVGPATIRKIRGSFSVSELSPGKPAQVQPSEDEPTEADENFARQDDISRNVFEEMIIWQSELALFATREALNVRTPIQALALQQELARQYFELATRMMRGASSGFWAVR